MYSLENLNALRVANGEKPLKAWKESKAKLKEKIDLYRTHTPYADDPTEGAPHTIMESENVKVEGDTVRVEFDEPTVSHHTLSLDDLVRNPKNKKLKAHIEAGSLKSFSEHAVGELKKNPLKTPQVAPIKGMTPLGKAPSLKKVMGADAGKVLLDEAKRVETKRNSVSLTAIAKELGMDPKVARAKMRRVKVPTSHLVDGEAHTYHLASKAWVINALQTDMRKKAKE
jgi:hypothetical protein